MSKSSKETGVVVAGYAGASPALAGSSLIVTVNGQKQELLSVCQTIGQTLQAAVWGLSLITDAQLIEDAKTLTVTSDESFQEAGILRQRLRNEQLKIEAKINAPIAEVREALDKLYELRKQALDPIVDPNTGADKRLKAQQEAYEQKKAREKREAEERAAAELRRQQEATRKAEAEALAAKGRKAREEAEARAAEARAAQARAQQVALATAARPTTTRSAGSSTRTEKVPEIVDMEAFMKGIIEGTVPGALLVVDEGLLMECWREDRAKVLGWPGVEVRDKVTVARK